MNAIQKKYFPAIKESLSGYIKKVGKKHSSLNLDSLRIEFGVPELKDLVWYPGDQKMGAGEYRLICETNADASGKKEIITVAKWEIVQMKNCCGMAVSTRALVEIAFRKLGLGLIMNQIRIDICRKLGYSCLMCTDVENNVPQQKILSANGWRKIHKFVNRNTGNTVCVHVINI